ncbi:hypothetical protein EMO89_01545 [Bifidobacterium tissieri]|uniref:PD-(D/E)XK nuclease family protein n=1 Tax=Bifidobacterium tissieri TaxID=1630162 RepID=A0A5M9ZUW0_9BIFI|nr:hypothetical protein [Bifidobacterium tissieri]KAA8831447.1 hypothetical protein EMO89_01545 [Bifidobacterium tissieri]
MSDASDILAVTRAANASPDNTLPGDAGPLLWEEIRGIIEHAISTQPRSLQTRIGPSELGTDCVHCLAAKLAAWPRQARIVAWLPYIGTAVHRQFETLFTRLETEGADRWKTEYPVSVGRLNGLTGGYEVSGSIDLWDRVTHATVDWKITGRSTRTLAKTHGPSQQYRVQASLYGIGLANQGEQVERSCIYFLPRDSITLADAIPWETRFDPEPGKWALARAQLLVNLLDVIETQYGVGTRDEWIRRLPKSESHCFDCGTWGDDSSLAMELHDADDPPLPDRLTTMMSLIEPTYNPTKHNGKEQ